MEIIIWEVKYQSPPKVIRYCKRCGTKTEYISSNLFRVNAQQKYLDIWLIYKCVECSNTWNMTIYTRVNPNAISVNNLNKFMENDRKLAIEYAMDTKLLKRNGAELELPLLIVDGEAIDFRRDKVLILKTEYAIGIMVSKILRSKLNLSRSQLNELVNSGTFSNIDMKSLKKLRLNGELKISINGSEQRDEVRICQR